MAGQRDVAEAGALDASHLSNNFERPSTIFFHGFRQCGRSGAPGRVGAIGSQGGVSRKKPHDDKKSPRHGWGTGQDVFF